MDNAAIKWLIDAVVVIGLVLLLWALISGPGLVVKSVLETVGAYALPKRLADWARRTGVDAGAVTRFFEQANDSMTRNGDGSAVRVVLDERHAALRQQLSTTEQRVREAVGSVQGLTGQGQGSTIITDLNELRERTRVVERMGVDLESGMEEDYGNRRRLRGELWMLAPCTLLIALANGAMLSLLFIEWTGAIKIFGLIPLAYVLGTIVVMLELAIGMMLYMFRRSLLVVIILMILVVVATCFEAFAMNLMSVEFSTALRGADISEAAMGDRWLVLLALVFTPVTSILGFATHKAWSELSDLSGKRQLADELKTINKYVDDLPVVWGSIEQKARNAEAAIERYRDALGGQDDRLPGALNALEGERKALSKAILGARVEEWPDLAQGNDGDARHAAVQNIALGVVVLVASLAYAGVVAWLVGAATVGRWPFFASVLIGLVTSAVFLTVGQMAFNRLRLVQGQDGRAQLMTTDTVAKVTAIAVVLGLAIGLTWVSVVVLGWWGLLAGVFITALGLGIARIGYGVERAARGVVLIAALLVALIIAIAAASLSILRYVIVWIIAASVWVIGFAVWLVARPAELVWMALRRKSTAVQAEPA